MKRIKFDEAVRILESEDGAVYLDVRSVPEFEAGHAPGAYNIPLSHMGPGGMQPNPEFEAVVNRTFAKDTPIVVGCKSGGRSARAVARLEAEGFTNLYDYVGGWSGGADDPGWLASGGESTTDTEAERQYEQLRS